MPVTVVWGTDRLQFDLPPNETLLSALRLSISAYTQLPLHGFSLVHDGAVMNDDNAPLSAYYLRQNSTITLVAAASEQPATMRSSEGVQIAAIQAEVVAIRTSLVPAHTQFLATLTPASKALLSKEHRRLSELLLQALLRVDGIVPERGWDTARAARKAAVRELQSLLDQLDAAWAAV